jgi:hypothetical protein
VVLVVVAALLVAGVGGFFYLVRQANVGPKPRAAEVAVDVNLAS